VSPEAMAAALVKFVWFQGEKVFAGRLVPADNRVNVDQVPLGLDL